MGGHPIDNRLNPLKPESQRSLSPAGFVLSGVFATAMCEVTNQAISVCQQVRFITLCGSVS